MAKLYGFSKIGQRIMAEKSGNRKGKRISVIAIRNHKHKLLHPFYFEGSTNKAIFKTYLTKILLLNLPKDSYLIMDNASFHKGEEIENLIKESNIKLIYLPTYTNYHI